MIKRPLAFIACLFLIMTIILMRIHPIRGNPPDIPEGSHVTVLGCIEDRQYKNGSYILTLTRAAPEDSPGPENSVLVYLEDEPASLKDLPPIGTKVKIKGKISFFREASNPGQFDMKLYYHIRGIEYRILNARLLSYGRQFDHIRESLFLLRLKIERIYDLLLPEKDSGILKAMILGDRTSLDPDIRSLYRDSGIAHALAISGLHISILGYGLYRLIRRTGLHPCIAAVFCTVFISLYSVMAGGSTSTIRAVIMFSTCMLADITGRTYDLLSALSLSLIVILLTDPMYIYDSGFMLSFGAVLGISIVSPVLNSVLPSGMKKTLSGLVASLSVSSFTLPVTLYYFYEIPAYAIVLNLVVVPLMGVLVVSAVFTAVLGMIMPSFGIPPAFICRLILIVYERGCQICQSIPASMITAGRPEFLKIIIYYSLLLSLCFFQRPSAKRKKVIRSFAAVILLMLLPLMLLFRTYHGITYTMLDIGQGDCNIITGEKGRTVMIDCGSSSEKEISRYRVIPFLKYNGISTIDAVVLTHMDSDHINGFTEILNMERTGGIKIRSLILSSEPRSDPGYKELIKSAEKQGIKLMYIKAGDDLLIGNLSFSCLGPEKGFISENENEYSTVLMLDYGNFNGLFTGDITGEGEEKMISRIGSLRHLTVLKTAHHGSRFSTPETFLNRVHPVYSLISAGKNNRYGHPHPELITRLLNAGSKVYLTAEKGAVTVKTDGKTIKIKGEKDEKD